MTQGSGDRQMTKARRTSEKSLQFSAEDRLALYERMFLVQSFERELIRLVNQAKVHGFVHLCLGQEGIEVGACGALAQDDVVVSTHRSHGHILARGGDPSRLLAEILGRQDGYSDGRGGEMHMAIPEIGILATTGIVGAGLPLAVGAGLAAKQLAHERVVLCFFGDGAVAQGTFHESLNVASLWRLPVIFLCEMNGYAEMSAIASHLAEPTVASRAASYGCTGMTVDGNDVEAVQTTVRTARGLAASGEGPVLVEAQTLLLSGHYEGVDLRYRQSTDDALGEIPDAVAAYRSKLLSLNVSEDVIAEREGTVQFAIARATEFALESPFPDAYEELVRDVYAP